MRTPILLATSGALVLAMQLGLPPAAPSDPPPAQPWPSADRPIDPGALILPPPPVAAATPFDRATAAVVPSAPAASWAFLGVARAGASTTLLIRDDAAATHLVRPGDHIGDWRVGGPVGTHVELLRGAERLSLSLDGPSGSSLRAPG